MHGHHNAHGPPHTLQPDRASPSRQGFKKEPGTLVYIEKPRTTPGLSGIVDLGPPLVEKQVFAYSTATIPKDRETRYGGEGGVRVVHAHLLGVLGCVTGVSRREQQLAEYQP